MKPEATAREAFTREFPRAEDEGFGDFSIVQWCVALVVYGVSRGASPASRNPGRTSSADVARVLAGRLCRTEPASAHDRRRRRRGFAVFTTSDECPAGRRISG